MTSYKLLFFPHSSILSIQQIINFQISIFAYNVYHDKLPATITSCFKKSHRLRNPQFLLTTNHLLENEIAKNWNKLPAQLKSINNMYNFKYQLKLLM